MVNIYKKKAQEAKSEITKSWYQWGWAWVATAIGLVLVFIGTVLVKAGNGCQAHSETVNDWSRQSEQRAHEKWESNNSEWKKEVEEVDSDSVSVTSSDDGEIVEIVV